MLPRHRTLSRHSPHLPPPFHPSLEGLPPELLHIGSSAEVAATAPADSPLRLAVQDHHRIHRPPQRSPHKPHSWHTTRRSATIQCSTRCSAVLQQPYPVHAANRPHHHAPGGRVYDPAGTTLHQHSRCSHRQPPSALAPSALAGLTSLQDLDCAASVPVLFRCVQLLAAGANPLTRLSLRFTYCPIPATDSWRQCARRPAEPAEAAAGTTAACQGSGVAQ